MKESFILEVGKHTQTAKAKKPARVSNSAPENTDLEATLAKAKETDSEFLLCKMEPSISGNGLKGSNMVRGSRSMKTGTFTGESGFQGREMGVEKYTIKEDCNSMEFLAKD